ncbi:MAG: hypothetical protein M1832_001548 [Thelocarpon impressellum]|nr:MAG: hypothetical protein M1832_001548 [Thelocarpon impressellum]
MQQHLNKAHGVNLRHKRRPRQEYWRPAMLQTFYTRPHTCWFEVGQETVNTADESRHTAEQSEEQRWQEGKEEEIARLGMLDEAAAGSDQTGWWKRTGWTEHFSGRDIGVIAELAEPAGLEEEDLLKLGLAVDGLVERAVAGVETLPHELRRWLKSPRAGEAGPKPLQRLQNKNSQDRYAGYWKQLLCYNIRLLRRPREEQDAHGASWSTEQREQLDRLDEMLQAETNEENLVRQVHRASMRLIFQRIRGDELQSPVMHFAAVLGIDREMIRLRMPINYTYRLAALPYIMRVLVAEFAWPAADRQDTTLTVDRRVEQVMKIRRDWLTEGSFSPMSNVLNLLAYGKAIASQTGSRATVHWSSDRETLFYRTHAICMEDYRNFVHATIEAATELLWKELMLALLKVFPPGPIA